MSILKNIIRNIFVKDMDCVREQTHTDVITYNTKSSSPKEEPDDFHYRNEDDIQAKSQTVDIKEQILSERSLLSKLTDLQKEMEVLKGKNSSLLTENQHLQNAIVQKTADLDQNQVETEEKTQQLLDEKERLINHLKRNLHNLSLQNKELFQKVRDANKNMKSKSEQYQILKNENEVSKEWLPKKLQSLSKNEQKDYFSTLNEEQKDAVLFNGKHLLVLAGAGTGKTRTIIARALHLVKTGINPKRILILSFTRKSASEIVNRIKDNLKGNPLAENLKGQTFHSWCMEIIKGNPAFKYYSEWTLLDEEDRESAVKLICGRNLKDDEGNKILSSQIIDVYSYMLNALCNLTEALRVKLYDNRPLEFIDAESLENNRKIFAEFIQKYRSYKNMKRYIDYDDLLKIVADGLKKNNHAKEFVSSLYDHILVDEMQDTNPLQYKLLSAFYDKCHLYCVGDDAQSIYGFRGADFKTMHRFTEVVPNSQKKMLTINYRSTQELLDISNWLLSQSSLAYNKKLTAFRGHGSLPYFIYSENDYEEANDITDRLIKSIGEKGLLYHDHLIISRTNRGLKQVERACLEKKIPYINIGGTELLQSAHIRDLVSSLRIVANFFDELAWIRYLQIWKGVGERTASKIIDRVIHSNNLEECLSKLRQIPMPYNQSGIYELLVELSNYKDNPVKAIQIASEGLDNVLSEKFKNDNWNDRKLDFPILKMLAQGCGSINELISEFILNPQLSHNEKKEGEEMDQVTLSTIHKAKGLEASQCYIVDVSPWAYPTPRALANNEVEEERRCLYVAMTRAKDDLYIYRLKSTFVSEGDKYAQIKINDIYIDRVNPNHEVKLLKLWKEGRQTKILYGIDDWENEMSLKAFRTIFKKKDGKDKTAEDLYFLNNLPEKYYTNLVTDGYKNLMEQEKYNGESVKSNMLDDLDLS